MITYRHHSEMLHPDLDGWQPRQESTVSICHQMAETWNYVAVAESFLWQIPQDDASWKDLANGWQVAYTPNRGGIIPGRDLARLDSFAIHPLPVLDAKGASWLSPVILTGSGDRAFPVNYAGADFLPDLTPLQTKAESIAREARSALLSAKERIEAGDEDAGIPLSASCRWAAVMLSVSHHLSPETIAVAGILDDVLIRRTLIVASGIDRRMDA